MEQYIDQGLEKLMHVGMAWDHHQGAWAFWMKNKRSA
jgi:hypothetical protein